MEKIDLKKYEELFKILPGKEFNKLEEALEKGLCLTPQGVEGEGRELLENEKLARALPSLHAKFKKIETMQKKQKEAVTARRGFNYYWDDNNWPEGFKRVYSITIPTTSLGINVLAYLPFAETIVKGENGIISLIGEMFFTTLLTMIPMTLVNAAIMAACLAGRDGYRRGSGFDKRIQKQKTRLSNKILEVAGSELGYTEKWVRKQEKEFLKLLEGKESQEFANAYNEVEKRLSPLHKIELHKNIERHLYREWGEEKNIEKTAGKFCKAKNAGVALGSLEQEIKQELDQKIKFYKKETEEFENLREKIGD